MLNKIILKDNFMQKVSDQRLTNYENTFKTNKLAHGYTINIKDNYRIYVIISSTQIFTNDHFRSIESNYRCHYGRKANEICYLAVYEHSNTFSKLTKNLDEK